MKISRYLVTFFSAGAALGFTQYNALASGDVNVAAEPVQYVRVCDTYGAGYFYIPGSDTCMKLGGEVYSSVYGADSVYARTLSERNPKKARYDARGVFDLATASDTNLGTLRTFARIRGDWNDYDHAGSTSVRYAYIELGGLRVGLDESAFNTFVNYFGDFIRDDVISGGGYRTNTISYTYNTTSGFSAVVSLEQGNTEDNDYNGVVTGYMPHVVLGAKYEKDWGYLSGVTAYDAVNKKWFSKAKVSLNVTDKLNIWGMAAYKNMNDTYYSDIDDLSSIISDNSRGIRAVDSFYGTWGGNWAGWVGASYTLTEKATANLQFAYEGVGNFYTAANVSYQIAPGLTVIPEINYHKWNDSRSELNGKSSVGAVIRLKRSF